MKEQVKTAGDGASGAGAGSAGGSGAGATVGAVATSGGVALGVRRRTGLNDKPMRRGGPARAMLALALVFGIAACSSGGGGGGGANEAPLASFTPSTTSGPAPLSVTFDASASSDPDGTIASYSWNFGDGTTASGATRAHTFTAAGVYSVVLTVTDNGGKTATASATISVTDATGNLPPTASFTATPASGTAPLDVSFDAGASSDADGAIASYAWDFGDGANATGATATHTFTSAGTFTVTLTVTDDDGAADTATEQVTVEAGTDPTAKALAASGLSVPSNKRSLESDSANLGLGAVVTASDLATGGASLVTTGTITQSSSGTWTYSASPNDRLRIEFSNGQVTEYVITQLDGDFSVSSTEEFLRRNHVFDYRVIVDGQVDLTFGLMQASNQVDNSVQGVMVYEGVSYTLDLATQGTYAFDIDSASYEYATVTQGSVTGEGYSLTVNESFEYKLINSVDQSETIIQNTWTVGSDVYAIADGWIRTATTGGSPSELDYWRAQGTVTRNGVAVGGIGMEVTTIGIDIYVEIDGERTILLSYTFA